MQNRKRLMAAVCALGGALAVCGFAARAPGRTLFGVMDPSAPAIPYYACDSNGNRIKPIGVRALGITTNFRVVCMVEDIHGSTQHRTCDSQAAIVELELARFNPGEAVDTVYCWESSAWSKPLITCSKTISASPPPPPPPAKILPCTNTVFTGYAWGSDP